MDDCSYSKLKSVDIESYDPDMVSDYPVKPLRPMNKPRRSCLKTCLCVTLVVVGLLVCLALIAGGCAYAWMAGHVREWTVTEPLDLPVVHVPHDELEVFKDHAKLFFDLIQAGQAPGDFAVSAKNLNGLAATSDFLRGHAFAKMKENEVVVSVSLPMDGIPGGKGRFLVGTETLTWDPDTSVIHASMVSPNKNEKKTFYDVRLHLSLMDDGKWNLMVLSGQFFGHPIPEDFINEHHNILEDLYDCDRDDDDCKHARKVIEGLDDITLEKDQVVFHGHVEKEESNEAIADDNSENVKESYDAYSSGSSYDGHRFLAAKAAESWSSTGGWKFHLARRLAAF